MATIKIVQATNTALGLPSRTKTITVSEIGRASRNVYNNLTRPQPATGGPGVVLGTPLTEQCNIGMIQVDFQGVSMDDREFATMSVAFRNQIAGLIAKTALVVTLDGVVQTANDVRTFV